MTKTYSLALAMLLAGNIAMAQQLLILNSGNRFQGRYDGGDSNTIRFIDEHGNRHKFDISEVQSLTFNPAPAASGSAYRSEPYAAPPSYPEPGYNDTDAPLQNGWTERAMIPAGAEITVRTIDPIDAHEAEPHRHFLASVENDVRDQNGNVVIPRGARAHLIVRDVGNGEIAVDLRSVETNGQRYILNTDNLAAQDARQGVGANKRTAEYLGGGALLGTVLGAVVGGGKGAAIGALAGGAGGAGAQMLTRGRAINIPSETVLRFRLDRPVNLYY